MCFLKKLKYEILMKLGLKIQKNTKFKIYENNNLRIKSYYYNYN